MMLDIMTNSISTLYKNRAKYEFYIHARISTLADGITLHTITRIHASVHIQRYIHPSIHGKDKSPLA